MNERRFLLGVVLTTIWLSLAGLIFYVSNGKAVEMKPNEWGDFFAGTSAPIAFLWLVIGYLQQGEELRMSTEALKLQAEELRNSVQQQRDLVDVARQQVQADRDAMLYERQQREEQAKPVFSSIGSGGSFRGDGHCTYRLHFLNRGNVAADLVVTFVASNDDVRTLLRDPLVERGKRLDITLETTSPLNDLSARLQLTFGDTIGRVHSISYSISRELSSPHSCLELLLVPDEVASRKPN